MNDAMLICLRCKSKTGQIVDFHVQQLVSIDGVPFTGNTADFRDWLMTHEARLEQLEHILGGALGVKQQSEPVSVPIDDGGLG